MNSLLFILEYKVLYIVTLTLIKNLNSLVKIYSLLRMDQLLAQILFGVLQKDQGTWRPCALSGTDTNPQNTEGYLGRTMWSSAPPIAQIFDEFSYFSFMSNSTELFPSNSFGFLDQTELQKKSTVNYSRTIPKNKILIARTQQNLISNNEKETSNNSSRNYQELNILNLMDKIVLKKSHN